MSSFQALRRINAGAFYSFFFFFAGFQFHLISKARSTFWLSLKGNENVLRRGGDVGDGRVFVAVGLARCFLWAESNSKRPASTYVYICVWVRYSLLPCPSSSVQFSCWPKVIPSGRPARVFGC